MGRAGAVATAAALEGALPADLRPVFDVSFIRSHLLYGEFVCRLVLGVLRDVGVDAALGAPASAEELAARAGLDPRHAPVPLDWMLRFLAARGWIDALEGAGPRYVSREPWPPLDPAPVREEQLRHAPSWAPAYVLAETVAREYPAFLRGQAAGEDVLFSPRRLRLWLDYFSNDNGLYVVNNRVGAAAADRWLPAPEGALVLELGGGLGSGALALLERLEASGRRRALAGYRFTELVPAFLRRGEQVLRARYPDWPGLAFGALDMDRPFGEQGVAAESVAMVYAVNTVHAARDLAFTLGEARRALRPGGRLVLSECVRPPVPIYADFAFNLMETFRAPRLDPRYRPHGGFLSPGHWRAALEAAGFDDVRFLPDIARVHDLVPDFAVAAIGATRP
jgi:SAM-dependent methyltransferase